MERIKTVHVITGLDIGGAEMMLYKLLSRMERSAFQSLVVSLKDGGALKKRISDLGIPVFTLGMNRQASIPIGFSRLLFLLRRQRPQILQTWLYHADLLGLLAGKLARVPAIAWNLRCSELRVEDYSRGLSLIIRGLAKLSHLPDAIIVNSLKGCRQHERLGYHPVRWQLIPNGFDTDLFRPAPRASSGLRRSLGLPAEAPLIGLVARFHPMKDHANFFKAAALLHKLRPEVHYILVGSGIDENNMSLLGQISHLGISRQVHLLGERQDIASITRMLDIATSSSCSGEGFSNAIGEAMACGVPCVVTDVGDSAYLVGQTGEVVPPHSPRALADAWHKILSMSEVERRARGKAARARIVSRFSLDEIVKQYEVFYQELHLQNQ